MNKVTLLSVLCAFIVVQRLRRRHYLTRVSLNPPEKSAWVALFDSKKDEAFIITMGFDVSTFLMLHNATKDYIWYNDNLMGGRPSTLNTFACLGLALHYLNSTMKIKTLCQIFGASPTIIHRSLHRTLIALQCSLKKMKCAEIRWPNPSEMEHFAYLVRCREPNLENVIGFVDGCWFPIHDPSNAEEQEAYYNGWKSCCNISNVIVFTPDGCIAWVGYNCPGSWHDSHVAQPLYELLTNRTPEPYVILGDVAFPRRGPLKSKILTPFKKNELVSDLSFRRVQIEMHRDVTSTRQAAEWGMHAIQSVFARTQLKLPTNKHTRKIILQCVWHLYNVRCRVMKINQIATVFSLSYIPKIYNTKTASAIKKFYNIEN